MRYLLIILCLYPFKIYADINLECESTRWAMNSAYSQKWGKSWVPQYHSHVIKNNNSTFTINGRNFVKTSKVDNAILLTPTKFLVKSLNPKLLNSAITL